MNVIRKLEEEQVIIAGEVQGQFILRRADAGCAACSPGETTADGKLTVEFAECLGACEFAPCMLAQDRVHGDLTDEKVEEFLKNCGCI